MNSAPMMTLNWLAILLLLAMVVAVAAAGIVLWLALRKKPQPRGFDVIQTSPKEQAEERR